jgi:glycosyltransferase involved in cell wall biosynthesis
MADARRTLQRVLGRGTFHLIHAHDVLFLRAALEALRKGPRADLPKVLTVHGPLWHEVRMLMGDRSPRFAAFARESEELAYAAADAVITVDGNLRDLLVREYGVPPAKIRAIPNGVDTDWFAPGGDPAGPAVPYFLVPRRLVPKNGVHVAIEAFARLGRPGVELWIAGDGPERPVLEERVRRHRLQGRVRFRAPDPAALQEAPEADGPVECAAESRAHGGNHPNGSS